MQERIKEILHKADEEGEIFLASLSSDQLRHTGFAPIDGVQDEDEFFGSFEYVDIYVLGSGSKGYVLKYIFDGDPRLSYYEYSSELGGEEQFLDVIRSYLELVSPEAKKETIPL